MFLVFQLQMAKRSVTQTHTLCHTTLHTHTHIRVSLWWACAQASAHTHVFSFVRARCEYWNSSLAAIQYKRASVSVLIQVCVYTQGCMYAYTRIRIYVYTTPSRSVSSGWPLSLLPFSPPVSSHLIQQVRNLGTCLDFGLCKNDRCNTVVSMNEHIYLQTHALHILQCLTGKIMCYLNRWTPGIAFFVSIIYKWCLRDLVLKRKLERKEPSRIENKTTHNLRKYSLGWVGVELHFVDCIISLELGPP